MNNTSPRSPDEQFEAILLQLTQSAEARASWSPYRALILLLVSCLRDIKLALRHLAANLPEPAQDAAQEADPEAGDAAPLPLHPTQGPRSREASEQSASRPRPRPQAAPATAPEAKRPPLPLWETTRARGRPAGTPQPATRHSTGLPPLGGPPKISARAKPAPWHAHIVPLP